MPEEFLRNDKLFDLYISSKGVAQRKGLGLSSVKKSMRANVVIYRIYC